MKIVFQLFYLSLLLVSQNLFAEGQGLTENLSDYHTNYLTAEKLELHRSMETWSQIGAYKFGIFQSLNRCQGLTNDGQGHFWFSANKNLLRTKQNYVTEEAANSLPFTEELLQLNANHIGDIDYFNQRIYAPIEDGNNYRHPVIAVFNAQNLELENFAEVPTNWQPDGLPWIAVDGKNNFLISSQYSQTVKINFYDLRSFHQIKQLNLSKMITSIQGGKVFHDALYVTANNELGTGFSVYKIDLISGQLAQVASLSSSVTEVEGMTFSTTGENEILHVLAVTGSGLKKRITLFDFKMNSKY